MEDIDTIVEIVCKKNSEGIWNCCIDGFKFILTKEQEKLLNMLTDE